MRLLKLVVSFFGLISALSVSAETNHELIKNLKSRTQKLPGKEGRLIKSFTNHSQSYIYDQALAIIAFSQAGDQTSARSLLQGLKSLQLKDGSLYFSYYMDGKSPYPSEGDKRFAGAIAWVALSAVHYQKQFKSKEFVNFNYKILSHLKKEMKPIEVQGKKSLALRFAPQDVSSAGFSYSNTAALEHNLDAYSAFKHFRELNPKSKFDSEINHLRGFILSMWDKNHSHFWSGATISDGRINKSELYLDNQTWSLLALDESDLQGIKPKKALELNCETFLVKNHEGITGFMDSKPTRRPASSQFVWSEGTLGQVLAMKKVNAKCDDYDTDSFISWVEKMKKQDGGIAYSTSTPNKDFTTSSSVAGTAWLYFAQKGINPFQI